MADTGTAGPVVTAAGAGLLACEGCGRVYRPGTRDCVRCGRPLRSNRARSLQAVWAWLIAGLIAYIPANIYPMLLTSTFGRTTENTILGGVLELVSYGDFFVAFVVFTASIVIPIGKFIAISYLAISVQRPDALGAHGRQRLFVMVEFIGRWSMIDVFVVAILAALVQLDFAASINPGLAAVSFALSVAFTMLSAQSFDPKAIWDASDKSHA